MTNLGGHDMETVLEAFHGVDDDAPTCFIAYTIKGYGPAVRRPQGQPLRPDERRADGRSSGSAHGIAPGEECDRFAGLDVARGRAPALPRRGCPSPRSAAAGTSRPAVAVPEALAVPRGRRGCRTQEGFGRILNDLARDPGGFADRIVTTSPDVTVSTNLGAWVNRRGLFDRRRRADAVPRGGGRLGPELGDVAAPASTSSSASPRTTCSCCWPRSGLAGPLFGARLLPIGTLYDPFICRGLDALNYACYQDARFLLVATPSGVSLAPEGGAHQSVDHAADRHRPARA